MDVRRVLRRVLTEFSELNSVPRVVLNFRRWLRPLSERERHAAEPALHPSVGEPHRFEPPRHLSVGEVCAPSVSRWVIDEANRGSGDGRPAVAGELVEAGDDPTGTKHAEDPFEERAVRRLVVGRR